MFSFRGVSASYLILLIGRVTFRFSAGQRGHIPLTAVRGPRGDVELTTTQRRHKLAGSERTDL